MCHDSRMAKEYGSFKYVDIALLDGNTSPANQLKGYLIDMEENHSSQLEWIEVQLESIDSKLLQIYYEKRCYMLEPYIFANDRRYSIKTDETYPETAGTAEFMVSIISRKGREYIVSGYWRKEVIPLEKQIIVLIPIGIKNLVIQYVRPLEINVMIKGSSFDLAAYRAPDTEDLCMGWTCCDLLSDDECECEKYDKNLRIYR